MRPGALWLVLGGIALLATAIGYRIGGTGKSSDSPRASTTAQSTIMGLVLVDAKGHTQRMDQWRGKVLVVNYWATWCFPCREEMPGYTPVNYPLLIGDMSTMAKSAELGNDRQALPFTAVFDREGKLAMSKLGRWHEADLEPKLADLILH
jgi:hypothetical protein